MSPLVILVHIPSCLAHLCSRKHLTMPLLENLTHTHTHTQTYNYLLSGHKFWEREREREREREKPNKNFGGGSFGFLGFDSDTHS